MDIVGLLDAPPTTSVRLALLPQPASPSQSYSVSSDTDGPLSRRRAAVIAVRFPYGTRRRDAGPRSDIATLRSNLNNGTRTGPTHRARKSQGCSGRHTRVQGNSWVSKLHTGRGSSCNRRERVCLLHRSEQFDSGAPSTPIGQWQLRKWTKRRSLSPAGVDSAKYESGQNAGGVWRRAEWLRGGS